MVSSNQETHSLSSSVNKATTKIYCSLFKDFAHIALKWELNWCWYSLHSVDHNGTRALFDNRVCELRVCQKMIQICTASQRVGDATTDHRTGHRTRCAVAFVFAVL